MRIGLLNQFLPPDQPPTARLVGDLAQALRRDGHEVVCIGRAARYGPARGLRRVLRDIGAHAGIAWKVLCGRKLDWVICLSDPTGLPLTARALASLKGARLAHWAMDVYPQIAVTLGAVKEGCISRSVAAGMRMGYRGCDLLVALDEDMAAEISRLSGKPVAVLPPWPPEVAGVSTTTRRPPACRRWLYSGNLGRAHEFRTLLEAQRLLEVRGSAWELHFQGGGPHRGEAEALAAQLGLRRCRWSGYVEDAGLLDSLLSADVLIATQKPETRGLLWPSKLALMRHLGIPIAWVGPTEGAIAEWLRAQPMPKLLVRPGQSEALADWLEALPVRDADTNESGAAVSEKIMAERRAGCDWWLARLRSI
jgi:hypothetical protein